MTVLQLLVLLLPLLQLLLLQLLRSHIASCIHFTACIFTLFYFYLHFEFFMCKRLFSYAFFAACPVKSNTM